MISIERALAQHIREMRVNAELVHQHQARFSDCTYAWAIEPPNGTYDNTLCITPDSIMLIRHVYPNPIPVYDPNHKRWRLSYLTLSGRNGMPIPDLNFREVVPLPDIDCLLDYEFVRPYLKRYRANIKVMVGTDQYLHHYRD